MNDAASFDAVAGRYDAARPSYPRTAVEWLVPRDAAVVVDVGAGTGIFTRLLARPGREVIAVEPSEPMLAVLHAAQPEVRALTGSAERIPLPDASVDAVTLAQAWHWVDASAASREVARVLRPGGILGLTWNLRDERVDWVHELGRAMRADGDHYRGEVEDPLVTAPFGAPERSLVEWTHEGTREGALDAVRSRSYFPLLGEAEQAETLAAVSAVLDRHGFGERVAMPYVTASYRYRRP